METLLDALSNWMPWLLRSSWQGAVLVALILVAQGVFGKRLSPAWRHALWGLLLLRLLLVWAPSSSLSVYNLAPNLARPSESMEYVPVTINTPTYIEEVTVSSSPDLAPLTAPIMEVPTAEQAPMSPAPTSQIPAALTPEETGLLLWLAVVLAMLIAMLAQSLRLGCRVRAGRLVTDSDSLEILEACRATLRVSAYLAVVETECVRSPALLGCLRPKLLLPIGLLDSLSREEKRHVFLHELAHVKRGDIWTGWLFNLLLTAHWFNPAIWLARRRFIADREAACDAHVLAALDAAGKRGYGHTVLNLVQRFNASPWTPGMAGISENNSNLKRRIIMIKQFNPPTRLAAWSGAGLCLCIGLATLTNAQDTDPVALEDSAANSPLVPAAPIEPETDIDLIREKAKALAEVGSFAEAITLLDQGRFNHASVFEEFSARIVKLKLDSGTPLSESEKKLFELMEEDGFSIRWKSGLGDLQIAPSDIYGYTAPNGGTMIAAQITNTGAKDATVDVEFWSGETETGTKIGRGGLLVPAGKTATESIPWVVENGTHAITVLIDPDNRVAESDEVNNRVGVEIAYVNGRFQRAFTEMKGAADSSADLAQRIDRIDNLLVNTDQSVYEFGVEFEVEQDPRIELLNQELTARRLALAVLKEDHKDTHPTLRNAERTLRAVEQELDKIQKEIRDNRLSLLRAELVEEYNRLHPDESEGFNEVFTTRIRGYHRGEMLDNRETSESDSLNQSAVAVELPAGSAEGPVVGPEIAPPAAPTEGLVVGPEIAPPMESTIGVVVEPVVAPPMAPVELPEIAPVARPVTEPVIVDP